MRDGKKITIFWLMTTLILISITLNSQAKLNDGIAEIDIPPITEPIKKTDINTIKNTNPIEKKADELTKTKEENLMDFCGTGDVNDDGSIDIGDVTFLISYLNNNGPAPNPLCLGDVNNDGDIDLNDVDFLISYLFGGSSIQPVIVPGDANEDGDVNVEDLVYLVNYLFKNGPKPHEIGGDVDEDGKINVSDLTALIDILY